ncbi:MAG: VCBS repeat-containing protein [Pyrinomonadaceae bacterium]
MVKLTNFISVECCWCFLLYYSVCSPLTGVSAMGDADANRNKVADFDGDGKSDISVFRPSNGFWHIMKSSGGFSSIQWGQKNDALVPGDYDGDGTTDTAVYRSNLQFSGNNDNGTWYIRKSSDNTYLARLFGKSALISGESPLPADYDGDGKTDLAVYNYTDANEPL